MSLGRIAEERAEMLEKTPLGREFSWREIQELSKYMDVKHFPMNTVIFAEGDRKAFMCIIYKGKVSILKESGNENKLITVIGDGKIFGEMSLIDGSIRSATAVSSEDTILMILTRQEFDRILDEKPRMGAKILQKIATVMSQRLRETTGVLADYLGKY